MQDLDNDTVIAAFLLETLGIEDRERVLDRIEEDGGYAERVQALETDLILRWHRGTLPLPERERFAKVYTTPARRRRVEEMGMFIGVAEMAAPATSASATQRVGATLEPAVGRGNWLEERWAVPRWAVMPAAAVLATAFVAGAYFGPWRAAASGPTFLDVSLTAVGERGPESAATGIDPVELPPTTSLVLLTVKRIAPQSGTLTAEVTSPDRPDVLSVGPVYTVTSPQETALTVMVPARDLPNGDYVLTVRNTTNGRSDVVSTQAFRVLRLPS
jgi:hypothetical protein